MRTSANDKIRVGWMLKLPSSHQFPDTYSPITLEKIRREVGDAGLKALAERLGKIAEKDVLNVVVSADFSPPSECSRPLGGIPIAVKDNIDVVPFETTGASPALKGHIPLRDAQVVTRLREAGAWFPVKLNMHELALGITSDNFEFGPVLNPFDETRTGGGSSGGSGAAVAQGIVPVSLGTDTGASIRIPAAFCGVVGLRPSTGRYSAEGILNISPTRDTIGVIASNVTDIAEIDSVIVPNDSATIKLSNQPLRLGLAEDALPGYCALVETCFSNALKRLSEKGVVEIITLPKLSYQSLETEIGNPIVFGEALSFWIDFCEKELKCPYEDFVQRLSSPDVRNFFLELPKLAVQSKSMREAVYKHKLPLLRSEFTALFSEYGIDMVVAPTSPIQPPQKDDYRKVNIGGLDLDTMQAVTRNTVLATLVGAPSISIPVGLDEGGLPVGMLLDGPIGADRRLLAWADRLEENL